ncbi:rhodanese-like domain-containing protein [Desulfobotulus mexicanus]|nr:rhodanese-like domain-containing protein [Desulfobotulus mexicanus]
MSEKKSFHMVLFFFSLFVGIATASCTQTGGDFWISQKDLKAYVEKKGDTLLLMDVREVHEFQKTHIPGSVNVPLSYLGSHGDRVAELLRAKDDVKEVLLICNTHNRSRKAREILMQKGVTQQIRVLEMGVSGYTKAVFSP